MGNMSAAARIKLVVLSDLFFDTIADGDCIGEVDHQARRKQADTPICPSHNV